MTGDASVVDALGLTRDPLARVLGVLDADGEEARVVGGAVRNALMGLPLGDIDIATTAIPDVVMARAAGAGFKAVPTGIEHGTVTVIADGMPFEVTTLRRDIETFGRRAKVSFGRDWKADAERRDFTINALAVSRDGVVHDFVGGRADIEAHRVRFIGEPRQRIAEDYLRILRFFRFHAGYGQGPPDQAGLAACIAERAGLESLSRERVRMELLKLLVAVHATPALAVMAECGILGRVLGGVPLLASFENMAKVELAAGIAPSATRRLGALAVQVVEDAERLGDRLRLTTAERERLGVMADGWRQASPVAGEQVARTLLYRLGPEAYTDRTALAFARSQASAHDAAWLRFVTLPDRWQASKFPLKAADFINRGLQKGPALGRALAAAEAAWVAAGFPDGVQSLNAIADEAARSDR